ncbi:MAG TPA: hypothetical protein VEL76_24100, partial [Gemmataceae bacterium]|nr:hypothetical protein [Gemmataceae bacterium]
MRWKRWACSLGLGLALASSSVHAQQGSPGAALGAAVPPPGCATPFPGPGVLPGPAPGQPDAGQPPAAQPPSTDAFAQAPPAGGAETGGFNPSMFGDQLGHSISSSSSSNRPAALATAIRGAYKITENDGPRPQDRVFFTYNYFNNVGGSQRADGTPQTDLHREMIGVEKTFLDGNASIQLRLPFIQVSGGGGASHSDVGDLTIFLKYAMINDRATGNVLTAGLGVTAPTGGDFISGGASGLRSTLLQPYIGAIYNIGDLYIQGFTSFIVPTDSRDVTFWNNDIGF